MVGLRSLFLNCLELGKLNFYFGLDYVMVVLKTRLLEFLKFLNISSMLICHCCIF